MSATGGTMAPQRGDQSIAAFDGPLLDLGLPLPGRNLCDERQRFARKLRLQETHAAFRVEGQARSGHALQAERLEDQARTPHEPRFVKQCQHPGSVIFDDFSGVVQLLPDEIHREVDIDRKVRHIRMLELNRDKVPVATRDAEHERGPEGESERQVARSEKKRTDVAPECICYKHGDHAHDGPAPTAEEEVVLLAAEAGQDAAQLGLLHDTHIRDREEEGRAVCRAYGGAVAHPDHGRLRQLQSARNEE